ncbi:hypothetical protein D3C76_1764950 [compost metagenome]
MELIDEAQRAVAQQATGAFAQGRELFAGEPDTALGRRIEAAQQVEQGTFARTGTADNGHALASVQLQRQA